MRWSLAGRSAVVTDAGTAVGRAIALRLADEGAALTLHASDGEQGAATAEAIEGRSGQRPLLVTGALADEAVQDALVATAIDGLGAIDVLVCNVVDGHGLQPLLATPRASFEAQLEGKVFATLRLMQLAVEGMRQRGWGRIITVGSLSGVHSLAGSAPVNVANEALRSLTRTAAGEWFRDGIVANVVCPPLTEGFDTSGLAPASVDDVAGAVAFLASDDACFMPGNTLFVDGGAHIGGLPRSAPLASESATSSESERAPGSEAPPSSNDEEQA